MLISSLFCKKTLNYLQRFVLPEGLFYQISSYMNIPHSSGLASSACGFFALTLALNELFEWDLTAQQCAEISRLGSGSSCRSFTAGWVLWKKEGTVQKVIGVHPSLDVHIGIMYVGLHPKAISSSQAMRMTNQNAVSYHSWVSRSEIDLIQMMLALEEGDFHTVGRVAQRNSQALHHMLAINEPSINYTTEITKEIQNQVISLQGKGYLFYCTQDAGPHIKILYPSAYEAQLKECFPQILCANPLQQPDPSIIREYVRVP